MQIDHENEIDENVIDENVIDENVIGENVTDENLREMGSESDEMEVEPSNLMSLDDINLTSTSDPVEPMIENHDNFEPFEPEPFEYEPEPISNDFIATPNQKDLEIDTLQNVEKRFRVTDSEAIKIIAPKELLEKLKHGHENVETLGFIDASVLEVQKPAITDKKSEKPALDITCPDEFLPDLDLAAMNDATDDDIALDQSVLEESVPTDSKESLKVIRDDHDYLKWSQRSAWPVIQNGI